MDRFEIRSTLPSDLDDVVDIYLYERLGYGPVTTVLVKPLARPAPR